MLNKLLYVSPQTGESPHNQKYILSAPHMMNSYYKLRVVPSENVEATSFRVILGGTNTDPDTPSSIYTCRMMVGCSKSQDWVQIIGIADNPIQSGTTIELDQPTSSSVYVFRTVYEGMEQIIGSGKKRMAHSYTFYVYHKTLDEPTQYFTHKKIKFGENGIFANVGDIRDFNWTYSAINEKFTKFSRTIEDKKLPIIITGYGEKTAFQIKNEMQELFDYDRLNLKPGRLVIGSYYLNCYITGIKYSKTWADTNGKILEAELSIATDDPIWRKDTILKQNYTSSSAGGDMGEFTFDREADFTVVSDQRIVPPSSSGQYNTQCPSITVGDRYIGASNFDDSDHTTSQILRNVITIDSQKRTIKQEFKNGDKANLFSRRFRASGDMFARIQPGTYDIAIGDYAKDTIFTISERYSEPQWEEIT